MMSRKYYVLVAELINTELQTVKHNEEKGYALRNLVFSMSDAFLKDNSRFIRSLFYSAAFKDTEFITWAISEAKYEKDKRLKERTNAAS